MSARFHLILVGLLISIHFPTLANSPIIIKNGDSVIPIGQKVLFWEDSTATMTIDQVLKKANQNSFSPHLSEVFNQKASQNAIWFKVTIQNLSKEDLWLELGGGLACWGLEFYEVDSNGTHKIITKTGAFHPNNRENWANFFWLPLASRNDSSTHTYFIRITSQLTKEYPLVIGSYKALIEKRSQYDYLAAGFMGLMLVMFFYNLFLFLSTKDNIYLRYIFYLATTTYLCTFINNYPLLDSKPWFDYYLVWNSFSMFSIVLFAVGYLKLPYHYPKWNKAIWIYFIALAGGTSFCSILEIVPMSKLSTIYNLCLIVFMTSLIGTGIVMWVKGHKHARLYVIGWTSALIGLFITMMTVNGILPHNLFTRNATYFGFGIEAFLFSLALADRLNTLQREKSKLQEQHLGLIEQQKEMLEIKVVERTTEIEAQRQEILAQNEELKQQQEEVEAQRDFIERQNEELNEYTVRITDSIRYAQTIQEAVLPTEEKLNQAFDNHFVLFKPKDIVSGDFFWMLEAGNTTYLAVADCTGHGVPGAFMSMIGISLLNEIVLGKEATSPKDILTQLNIKIRQALKQDQDKNHDGMDIAICSIVKGNDTSSVSFSGAKNGIILCISPQLEPTRFKGDRKLIGGYKQSTEKVFTEQTWVLPKGSLLYMGTDGWVDQGNPQDKKIGTNKLMATLKDIVQLSLEEQKNILEKTLAAHQQNALQRDDITILGIKI